MRISITSFIPDHGTHIVYHTDPRRAQSDVQSGLAILRGEFGNWEITHSLSDKRSRTEYTFKGGARLVKTIQ